MGAYLSLSGSEREVGWGGGGRLFEAVIGVQVGQAPRYQE